VIDESLIGALHVQSLRHRDLHSEHEPHVVFQASTIGALLDGAYDGDVTFAELAEHGDLGLGTINGLDGEMIAVDGRFLRADIEGTTSALDGSDRTPFAVVVWFTPTEHIEIGGSASQEDVLAAVDDRLPATAVACALRIDGHFDRVRVRSVPKQNRPYRPLAEVVADQHVFYLEDVEGTIVGFRFPDYSQGIEVSGYHLHFASADRARGGHVLDFRARDARVQIDPSADLHLELPTGVDLEAPDLTDSTRAALAKVERSG
jgi:acetolactate decarboxylase